MPESHALRLQWNILLARRVAAAAFTRLLVSLACRAAPCPAPLTDADFGIVIRSLLPPPTASDSVFTAAAAATYERLITSSAPLLLTADGTWMAPREVIFLSSETIDTADAADAADAATNAATANANAKNAETLAPPELVVALTEVVTYENGNMRMATYENGQMRAVGCTMGGHRVWRREQRGWGVRWAGIGCGDVSTEGGVYDGLLVTISS